MKKTLLLISITFFGLFSCEKTITKSDFIGNWSTTSDTNVHIDIEFYLDSMVVNESLTSHSYTDDWVIEGSKIKQSLIRGDTSTLNRKNTLNYKFNTAKDTLFLKHENENQYHIKLTKINNGFNYFKNKVGINFKFKKNTQKLTPADTSSYKINIYLGFKNNKFIAKTDASNDLNSLITEVLDLNEIYPKKEHQLLQYMLFIDERVPQKKIDSIKTKLDEIHRNKIFIVYDFNENKWNETPNWLGIYEE